MGFVPIRMDEFISMRTANHTVDGDWEAGL
jgi:hypothetical protein